MNAAIFLILLTLSKCSHSMDITVEEKEIVTRIGEAVQLSCSAEAGKVGCSFLSPLGRPFIMNSPQSTDEEGRIQAVETKKPNNCTMKITEIRQSDNGNWRCNVTCTKCDSGKYDVGVNVISVIVAIPPAEVYLTMNDERITDSIEISIPETKDIKCIAAGANPKPEFNWYLSEKLVNKTHCTTREENVEDGRINYMSIFQYEANTKDFGKLLKCNVSHKGYINTGTQDEKNAVEAKLSLRYDNYIL
jgi:hypothetical protein